MPLGPDGTSDLFLSKGRSSDHPSSRRIVTTLTPQEPVSDIDAVADSLKCLTSNGRLEKRTSMRDVTISEMGTRADVNQHRCLLGIEPVDPI